GINGNQNDNSELGAGAVYMFVRTGTNWSQQAFLKASNTEQLDSFGASVAIFGGTVVVGATFEDSDATGANGNQSDNSAGESGAAYVFRRNANLWFQESYLKASNTNAGDSFGTSVAVWGDTAVNGDQGDDSAVDAGAAYVFIRAGGSTWGQEAYLKASNADAGDRFGGSVAAGSQDLIAVGDRDEASAAIGVNGDQADNTADLAGAVYVFTRSGTWTQEAYVKASNTDGGDRFGTSIGMSGSLMVVGASREDSNATGVNGDQSDDSSSNSGA
ncbi:MAG TPA: integrin, partial [Gemmatimonadetes bacterium]|nr:integrin [Gemmatimonadota bacterium]